MTNEFVQQPTEKKYQFRARVETRKVWIKDQNEQGHESKYEATLCFLIPEPSDQSVAFFSAWLPELVLKPDTRLTYGEPGNPDSINFQREIAMILGSPITSPCRGAVMRGNWRHPAHHIMVMSVGVEDEITQRGLSGGSINVTVLSEKDESIAEDATDTNRDMKSSYGQ